MVTVVGICVHSDQLDAEEHVAGMVTVVGTVTVLTSGLCVFVIVDTIVLTAEVDHADHTGVEQFWI